MSQTDPKEHKRPRAHWTVASLALVLLGLLVFLPSGLCVGFGVVEFIGTLIFDPSQVGDSVLAVVMIIVIGVPFAAGGIAIIISGLNSRRID